ncbi:hypothetical protein FA13DRAFT_1726950 [Coprinellus micaceus]|uniref:Arrestin-like N-terminal domain-containing protein n=1 Tax=Coprinellus micaceus TaxID=71717 RepID=A0A4Y7TR00_COPMI|nr:hypothetical protein FA13DRAFT_1726950 [Coprinellus micaceus]
MALRAAEGPHPPPRYSTLSLVALPIYPTAGELDISRLVDDPSSSDRVSRQAFDFCLEAKGGITRGQGKPWATLRLFSTVPASLQRPRYTGGENVDGVVLLDLQRSQSVLAVSVVLKGQMLTSSRSDGIHTFLDVVAPVWDSTTAGDGNLQGRHTLPFTIPFPTEFPDSFAVRSQRKTREGEDDPLAMFPTPQTICQRGINANVQYEVTLKITTSGLFKSRHRVSGTILHVPVIRAPPLPPLRASAYVGGSFLIGPRDDPTGWQPLPTFHVRAAVRGGESCHIECTVSIANPTTYTRGTVIPCYLVCRTSSTDDRSNAILHAFTAQNCVSLDLFQRVHYYQDPRVAAPVNASGAVKIGQGSKAARSNNSEEGGTAVWWTPRAHVARGDVKEDGFKSMSELSLEGEVHIDVALLPTCAVPFLEVSHDLHVSLKGSQDLDVTVIPEDPSGTLPSALRKPQALNADIKELPAWSVRIVTAHAPAGPVPTPFTPRPARKKKDLSVVQELQYINNSFSAGPYQ